MRRGITALLLVAVALAASPRVARAQNDDLNDLVKAFSDDQKNAADREAALERATALARALSVKPERVTVFKDALKPLLASLAAKKTDKTYEKLILDGFSALDVFVPFPDVGSMVHAYLDKDVAQEVRTVALNAIEVHGAQGVQKDLIAVLKETAPKERVRELLERAVVACTCSIPTDEAEAVLLAALKVSQFKNVKRAACAGLGDLNQLRPAREVRAPEARAALLEAASATNPEPDVAAAATLALLRFNSFEGVGEMMKRLDVPHGNTRLAYKTICDAAHKHDGFLGLPPERFYEVSAKRRDEVLAEIKLWWQTYRGKSPDQAVFDAIREAGVETPRDTGPSSKEAITALIEGLDVDPRTLRYAALDLLVKRTGRTDLAADFKVLKSTMSNNQINISEWEPSEGFGDPGRREQLRKQQKTITDQWRRWWKANADRAVLGADGVWITK